MERLVAKALEEESQRTLPDVREFLADLQRVRNVIEAQDETLRTSEEIHTTKVPRERFYPNNQESFVAIHSAQNSHPAKRRVIAVITPVILAVGVVVDGIFLCPQTDSRGGASL